MERTFGVGLPIDLRLSLRGVRAGRGDPSLRVSEGEAWLATRTPSGPATIRLTGGGRRISAAAWGPGAGWALEHAPAIAGAEDDITGFDPTDPLVARLHARYAGLRIVRTARVVETAVRVIVGQKVTGAEATRSYARLAAALGDPAPGPGGLTLPPAPERLAGLPYHGYHPFGIERTRAERIRRAARHAGRLEEAAEMGLPEARARLQAVPGIGPWTAALTALVALGDPDAVGLGDYNLPNMVCWALAGERRGGDERMLELLAAFSGHRGRVIALLEASGVSAPRFGPRMPTRSFERM